MKAIWLGLAGVLAAGSAFAQEPAAPAAGPPDLAAAKAHNDAAAALAGQMWQPEFQYLCTASKVANSRDAPAIEPLKLFDNLYAVGLRDTVVYALITPQGVVLLDAGYANKVETVVVPGLRQLGIEPDQVKLVLVAHGHPDHFGGASYFQERGARVGAPAGDWAAVDASLKQSGAAPLRHDLQLEEGKPVTFGGVTITPVYIPGHTPGAMGFIFPVSDSGTPHVVGIFASGGLNIGGPPAAQLAQMAASARHFGAVARTMKVDVELQNHPLYDLMWERAAQLRNRAAGQPNPYVVGTDGYRRFNGVMSECMLAQLAREGGTPAR